MVRLVVKDKFEPYLITMFQFQCGAIGSAFPRFLASSSIKFQFQCGAIGSFTLKVILASVLSFNSSVVRLVALLGSGNINIDTFQFQCGAIGSKK